MGWGAPAKGSWGKADPWAAPAKGSWGKADPWGAPAKGSWGKADPWGAPKGKGFGKDFAGKGFGNDKGFGKGKKGKGKGLHDFKFEQRVWLGSIPDPYDRDALKEHLNQAGECKWVSVAKGQGGAAFSTEDEAQNAIAILNGSEFAGAVIEVDVWTQKEKTA